MRRIQTKYQIPMSEVSDIDILIHKINMLKREDMWDNESPLWLRPQYRGYKMYRSDEYLQVIGHTPVPDISMEEAMSESM